MRSLSLFYDKIKDWSDYKLETEDDYVRLLFPDRTDDLTDKDIARFRSDDDLRRSVVGATLRMMEFYGYKFVKKNGEPSVQQIKELKRREKGIYVGLYSEKNYKRLTKMMFFLNRIKLRLASSLVMLALCDAMRKDPVLKQKIRKSGTLESWIDTQKYVNSCKLYGLNYVGNSCYQDSVLLALFGLPNMFITNSILNKDVKKLGKEIECGYKTRRKIQDELVRITMSMRGEGERVRYCTGLRAILAECPGSQEFHGRGTQDAGEFLQYLFSIFEVGGTRKNIRIELTNDLGIVKKSLVTERMINSSPIIVVPQEKLGSGGNSLDNFLEQKEDAVFDENNLYKSQGKKYKRRIEYVTTIPSDFLVFYVQRIDSADIDRKNYAKVIPQMYLGDLELYAIIVHRSNHYTCYINCGEWYYYNDMGDGLLYVGDYDDMLSREPSVRSEGVLYFYGKK
jgi:hypothetical protein